MHDRTRNLCGAYNVRLGIAKEQCSAVIQQNLLHIDHKLATLCTVELNGKLCTKCIILGVAVARAVLRVVAVDVRAPVPVEIDLRITRICCGDVRNQKIILAVDADLVEQVIVDCLDLYVNSDLLCICLYCLCIDRQLCTAVVDHKVNRKRLAVLIADAVAIRIRPACLIKQRLCTLNIVGIWISQLIEPIVKGRRNWCLARDERTLQDDLVVCLAVGHRDERSADLRIAEDALLVDARKNRAQ